MKLQISFDLTDLDKALEIALKVAPYASILEVGSLLLYKYGTKSIERFKETFPNKTIFVDAKIIDRGKEAVSIIADAGADWITVMAGTSKNVIHSVTNTAHERDIKVMLDLLDASSLGQSALEAKSLGADAVLFHEPYDEEHEGTMFLDKWEMVRGNTEVPIFISSKITREVIDEIIAQKPDGIIIGKTITDAKDPEAEAKFYQEKISPNSH